MTDETTKDFEAMGKKLAEEVVGKAVAELRDGAKQLAERFPNYLTIQWGPEGVVPSSNCDRIAELIGVMEIAKNNFIQQSTGKGHAEAEQKNPSS